MFLKKVVYLFSMSEQDTKKYTGLEGQFFTWSGWDNIDTAAFQFYDCKLIKDVGTFKEGEVINCVLFDVEKSLMEFYDDKGNVAGTFKLIIEASAI